jgi:hypothetical protein
MANGISGPGSMTARLLDLQRMKNVRLIPLHKAGRFCQVQVMKKIFA